MVQESIQNRVNNSSKSKKRPVNKSTKTSIVFDASARKDFLTGFRRRKQERRKKAAEKMDRQLKEEIKNAK